MTGTDGRPPRIARVAVDVALPHLDRLFDYEIPEGLVPEVRAGVRVRVRFSGKLADGFVLDVGATSDADAKLRPLERLTSPEVVLHGEMARLCRAVADHYGGVMADVVRLAVPTRHAATEAAAAPQRPLLEIGERPGVLPAAPGGDEFLRRLGAGGVRAAWQPVPAASAAGDWAGGLVDAAAAALAAGRGALLLVPEAEALGVLTAACQATFGAGTFVSLSAELGPAARYRAFLAASRGDVALVIGTRSAVYAPVSDLGLIALWDEGNDLYAEPRAPYPHTREVAMMRAAQQQCGLLVAGYARSPEVQSLVERGWLASIGHGVQQARRLAPAVRVASDTDLALERDPAARSARLPRDVFVTIRAGLASGPVLLQVPRGGYVTSLICRQCGARASCGSCSGPLRGEPSASGPLAITCAQCGPRPPTSACRECGGRAWRTPAKGVRRTAEELGRAFPQTRVVESWSGHRIHAVPGEPALVLCTPGAEPVATNGYAAAVLLDASVPLSRPELRAAEETLRRWLAVSALVRPAADGGTVMVVGEPDARAIQALVRVDPVGFAERELAERRAAGFPPGAKVVTVEGSAATVSAFGVAASATGAEVFGPVDLPGRSVGDQPTVRLTARCPLDRGGVLVGAVKAEASARSARKDPPARIRVDPQVLD